MYFRIMSDRILASAANVRSHMEMPGYIPGCVVLSGAVCVCYMFQVILECAGTFQSDLILLRPDGTYENVQGHFYIAFIRRCVIISV